MQGNFFEDWQVGDQFSSPRRTMTETDVVLFTSLTGLLNPLFIDQEFAVEKGLGARLVPGPLTMGIIIGITDYLCYGTMVAVLGIDNARFTAPVKIGDTIWSKVTVGNKRESASHADRGIVTLQHEVYNQKDELVCKFERTLMFLKRG